MKALSYEEAYGLSESAWMQVLKSYPAEFCETVKQLGGNGCIVRVAVGVLRTPFFVDLLTRDPTTAVSTLAKEIHDALLVLPPASPPDNARRMAAARMVEARIPIVWTQ